VFWLDKIDPWSNTRNNATISQGHLIALPISVLHIIMEYMRHAVIGSQKEEQQVSK